jgi:hypothetical protein
MVINKWERKKVALVNQSLLHYKNMLKMMSTYWTPTIANIVEYQTKLIFIP